MQLSIKKINGTQAIQIFQVARYGALMASSILLTKSALSQSDIGHYETFILISGSLSFFWINGILNTFLSLFHKNENKKAVVGNTALLLLSISAVIILVLGIFRTQVSDFYHFDADPALYRLLLVYFLFNNVSFLVDYVLLAKNNIRGLLWLSAYHLLFQTAFIAGSAWLFHDYHAVLQGLALFISIKFIIALWFILKDSSLKPDPVILRYFWKTAGPLVISFFLGGISIYVDGIIVNHYYDKSTFALYRSGAREFPLSLLLANAFSASTALLISKDRENLHLVRSGSLRMMQQLFPVCIVLLMVSQWLYPVIFNPNFASSYMYFNIYLLLLIPRLVFPHSILIGMGKTNWILIASGTEFILNILISISLMLSIGLQGIAYGTVIAFLVNKAILTWQLHKQGFDPNDYIPVKQLTAFSAALVAAFIIFTYCI